MGNVSHDWAEESPEAKARWFQTLTPSERLAYLCEIVDLALAADPHLVDRNLPEPVKGRIRVITLRDVEAQRASGNKTEA